MYLSICTGVYGAYSYPEMLDKVKAHGLHYVELCVGGWGPNPHGYVTDLLADAGKLEAFQEELAKREMKISALNCSGNQLAPGQMGEKHSKSAYDTVTLAGKLGVRTVVMMSGLPAGAPGDQTPNWVLSTQSVPPDNPYLEETVRYQWEDVAIPWWKEFFSVLSMLGYHDVVSLEMEDLTMSVEAGVTTSIEALEATISR